MKATKYLLSLIIGVSCILTSSAQEQYLHLYKGGTAYKSYTSSSIDSALFSESGSDMYLNLYRHGVKYNAANIAELDSFKIGEELKPSGVYMGVIGFNQSLYTKEIGTLSSSSKSSYSSFISNLTSAPGTVLYYAVDNALTAINEAMLPEDLVNISLITFTDGLDQGSLMMNTNYTTNDNYLFALGNRIKETKIQGIPITAYTIGLHGNDVIDIEQFRKNLQALASSEANAIEVSDIANVNTHLEKIANKIYNESSLSTISLSIPGQNDGNRIRITFDNANDATSSTMYIEGTFRMSDYSLTNLEYHGLSCESNTKLKGHNNGIYITYTFENLKNETSTIINSSNIDMWNYIPSSENWQINSEFSTENITSMNVNRKSSLIMLVLDCSSSLGEEFNTIKQQATDVISQLAEYGNDNKFTATNFDVIDIFENINYDELLSVKGGTFTMGATYEQGTDYISNELPTIQVTLDNFFIGKYEVTQELWEYVMSYNGICADGSTMSAYASDVWLSTNPTTSYGLGKSYPAYYVSYNDIVNIFIPRLNQITGKTFRLPTEAEWEFAARGGDNSKNYKYSGSNTADDAVWHSGNAGNTTHVAGTKIPNEIGLYDMNGNVWEWCSDWYGSFSSYNSSSVTNPTGPSKGSYRVRRGGSFRVNTGECRVSSRRYSSPSTRANHLGFRLALSN